MVTKSAPTPKVEPGTKKAQGAKIKLPKAPRVTRKSSTEKGDGTAYSTIILFHVSCYLCQHKLINYCFCCMLEADKKPKVVKKKPDAPGTSAPKSPKAIGKAKMMTFKGRIIYKRS